jgi:hypothetical protein
MAGRQLAPDLPPDGAGHEAAMIFRRARKKIGRRDDQMRRLVPAILTPSAALATRHQIKDLGAPSTG